MLFIRNSAVLNFASQKTVFASLRCRSLVFCYFGSSFASLISALRKIRSNARQCCALLRSHRLNNFVKKTIKNMRLARFERATSPLKGDCSTGWATSAYFNFYNLYNIKNIFYRQQLFLKKRIISFETILFLYYLFIVAELNAEQYVSCSDC